MRIFFIGDIVGKPGRKIVAENLPSIREKLNADFVVANGENSAGGNGITKNMAEKLFRAGIDALTLGDHIWDQRCFEGEIDSLENLCRPANIPRDNPGREFVVVERNGMKLGVFCLLGQTLMKIKSDCPFAAASRVVDELAPLCDAVMLDFHAETSSEKVSMGWHMDGKIQALVGTHTHIPTNDARILPQGLAFLSDAGMTGPWTSCLGADSAKIHRRPPAPLHYGGGRQPNLRGADRHRHADKTSRKYRTVHLPALPQHRRTLAKGEGRGGGATAGKTGGRSRRSRGGRGNKKRVIETFAE